MASDEQRAEALEDFWTAGAVDKIPVPPDRLDPEMRRTVQRLDETLRPPQARQAFKHDLRRQLDAALRREHNRVELIRCHATLGRFSPSTRWIWGTVAAALLLAVVGGVVFVKRPHPVSAQEILGKARTLATSPASANLWSLITTEQTDIHPGNSGFQEFAGYEGVVHVTIKRWYRSPNRWRIDRQYSRAQSQPIRDAYGASSVEVSDGTDVWTYDIPGRTVTVHRLYSGQSGLTDLASFGQPGKDLRTVLRDNGRCYDPHLQGVDSVAGRDAYVIDLGPSRCPSQSSHELDGSRVLWVDKETSLILKSVLYTVAFAAQHRALPYMTTTVTHIQYGPTIPRSVFTFVAPAGTKLYDYRPQPVPTVAEYTQTLRRLAAAVAFPLYAPPTMPLNLVPEMPRIDEIGGVQLAYVPPNQSAAVSADLAGAIPLGLYIEEHKAGPGDLTQHAPDAQRIRIGDSPGWTGPAILESNGAAKGNSVSFVRGGTLLRLSTQRLSREGLMQIAIRLVPVPGGHAALTMPQQPTLASLRRTLSFPIFVPRWTPPGVRARPPHEDSSGMSVVTINYGGTGSVEFSVLNGPAGCCLAADPRKWGTRTALLQGITAHLLQNEPQFGGPILWWERDGTYVAVSGPHLTTGDLIKIGSSMSRTYTP